MGPTTAIVKEQEALLSFWINVVYNYTFGGFWSPKHIEIRSKTLCWFVDLSIK